MDQMMDTKARREEPYTYKWSEVVHRFVIRGPHAVTHLGWADEATTDIVCDDLNAAYHKGSAEKDKVIEGLRKVEAAARAYVEAERENTAYIEKCKAEGRSFSSEPMIAALTRFAELKELLSSLAPTGTR